MLHPVFMTSTYSRQLDIAFDQVTGQRVDVKGKLIKEYLKVEPFKLSFDTEKSAPQVFTHFHGFVVYRLTSLDSLPPPASRTPGHILQGRSRHGRNGRTYIYRRARKSESC